MVSREHNIIFVIVYLIVSISAKEEIHPIKCREYISKCGIITGSKQIDSILSTKESISRISVQVTIECENIIPNDCLVTLVATEDTPSFPLIISGTDLHKEIPLNIMQLRNIFSWSYDVHVDRTLSFDTSLVLNGTHLSLSCDGTRTRLGDLPSTTVTVQLHIPDADEFMWTLFAIAISVVAYMLHHFGLHNMEKQSVDLEVLMKIPETTKKPEERLINVTPSVITTSAISPEVPELHEPTILATDAKEAKVFKANQNRKRFKPVISSSPSNW